MLGYATVPVRLLEQTDLGTEAIKALNEVSNWSEGIGLADHPDFSRRYSELLEILVNEQELPVMSMADDSGTLRLALTEYTQRHPPTAAQLHEISTTVRDKAHAELMRIDAHEGFSESPLFGYREDYSQYLPRGHYTASRRLRQYFKAMMWYGRITFLIHGRPSQPDALISDDQARVQTLAASLLAGMLERRLPDNRTLDQVWKRIHALSAFFGGIADQLSPYDYRAALRETLGDKVAVEELLDATKLTRLRERLARLRVPVIYAGLGDQTSTPDGSGLPAVLRASQGLRLMGQRHLPDSNVLGLSLIHI